jgi:hypothetical protein
VTAPAKVSSVVSSPQAELGAIVGAIPEMDVVLVLHSNSGLYAASIAERCSVQGIVFVDAGIPVESGEQPIAPERLVAQLRSLASADGYLPAWNEWFDAADVDELFGDPLTQKRLTTGLPPVLLSYLESSLTIRPGWMDGIAPAYLAFGTTYATELGRARKRGWPTHVIEGKHLHMVIDPEAVAAELIALI